MTLHQKRYDVIISGGGPAGATAGYLLAKFGYRVLLFDKKKFPRDKLCGGLTTHKTQKLLERIFQKTEADLKAEGIFDFSANKYELRHNHDFMYERRVALPFHFVKRIVYDDFLLNQAKAAGVKVVDGEAVENYDLSCNKVKTAAGDSYYGRFLVGADGVHSRLRRHYPHNRTKPRTRWRNNLCTCFEIFVNRQSPELKGAYKDIAHPILIFGAVDWGYAWLFPRQAELVLGMGGIYTKNKETLRRNFRDHVANFGIASPANHRLKSYAVPCGGHIKRPVFKNSLLVGDAGGVVDPLLGEGIFYGQRSAELAAWSIHRHFQYNTPVLEQYSKLLWKYVYSEFINAKILRFLGFHVASKFNHIPTKLLFHLMPEILVDVLHGTRTSKGLVSGEKWHRRVEL